MVGLRCGDDAEGKCDPWKVQRAPGEQGVTKGFDPRPRGGKWGRASHGGGGVRVAPATAKGKTKSREDSRKASKIRTGGLEEVNVN